MLGEVLVLVALTSSSTAMQEGGSKGCLDDSDCVALGHKFACFFYKCINWVDKQEGIDHCARDKDCGKSSSCYKHHNLREVSSGICFPNQQLATCNHHSDCKGDIPHCCGHRCCPHQYYLQWKEFSCVTDLQCRTWNTGDYCCHNSRCCNENQEKEVAEVVAETPTYDYSYEEEDEEVVEQEEATEEVDEEESPPEPGAEAQVLRLAPAAASCPLSLAALPSLLLLCMFL